MPDSAATTTIEVVGRVTRPIQGDTGNFLSSWPGTKVGIRFRGTGLIVRMADCDREPLPPPDGGWGGAGNTWDIVIDGLAQPAPLVAQRSAGDLTIANGLPMGVHVVWMIRRTEASRLGRVHFLGVRAVDGEILSPPCPKNRRIEVVGSSVETGHHVGLSANDTSERHMTGCGWRPCGQNQSRAWPKLTGDLLRAETINISVEGAGLLVGYQEFGGAGVQLPQLYPRADLFCPQPLWESHHYPVDIVLVAAGWSDVAQLDPSVRHNANLLRDAYETFLRQIRIAQPLALIYAVVRTGDGRAWHRRAMSKVIEAAVEARRMAHDKHIRIMKLRSWSSDLANCNDHPSWSQHESLAREAAPLIRRDTGW